MKVIPLSQLIKDGIDGFIKNHGKKITLTEGNYLFRKNDEDYSICFLESGTIDLLDDGKKIITVFSGDIIGERGFINFDKRPLDAIAKQNCIVYRLDREDFENFQSATKEVFLYALAYFVSNRVNNLNQILSFISHINTSILAFINDFDESSYKKIFSKIIDVEGFLLLKYEHDEIQKIYGNMHIDEQIYDFVIQNISNEIKFGKNYIFVRCDEFVYLIFGKPKADAYILVNGLYYGKSMFKYLGQKIEEDTNKRLNQYLK